MFLMEILAELKGFEKTLEMMGRYAIPRGYIMEFQCHGVCVNDGVADIGGIGGGLGWSNCYHYSLWQFKGLSFTESVGMFFTQPVYVSTKI